MIFLNIVLILLALFCIVRNVKHSIVTKQWDFIDCGLLFMALICFVIDSIQKMVGN